MRLIEFVSGNMIARRRKTATQKEAAKKDVIEAGNQEETEDWGRPEKSGERDAKLSVSIFSNPFISISCAFRGQQDEEIKPENRQKRNTPH
jgi:hypothetical protein